jgi:hypothetical protein
MPKSMAITNSGLGTSSDIVEDWDIHKQLTQGYTQVRVDNEFEV